jgi:phosphoadenosine phosphosulfate reductase
MTQNQEKSMRKLQIMPKLKELVEVPMSVKLELTDFVIDKQLRELGHNIAVAWSGGKDSTLVLWFVLQRYPDIPVIFNNTGIEYPETIAFVREITSAWSLNLFETKPIKTFWQCVDEYGFPHVKNSRSKTKTANGSAPTPRCCYWLKERPAQLAYREVKAKGIFTGITAVENRNRQLVAIQHGTCYRLKKTGLTQIHPILYWTENEVRQFHSDNNIPLNEVYSKGCDRCGCSCCTAFLSWESQLSRMNPKLYAMVKLRKDGQYVM